LQVKASSDCKEIEFQWKPPQVINAPKVCNYSFRIDYSQLMYTPFPKYVYSNPSFYRIYKIEIEAINGASCYSDVKTCSGLFSSPKFEEMIFVAKCPENSSNILKFNRNHIFKLVIFILFSINF
jgi:hypothetical protein